MTTRRESLRRCRCGSRYERGPVREGIPGWCGYMATQEDGLCDHCRNHCPPEERRILTPDEVLIRDGVVDPV